MSITSLQERLEQKALARAKEDAEAAVRALPSFDCIIAYCKVLENERAQVSDYHTCEALKKAIREKLYTRYLEEETSAMLRAVEQIQDLSHRSDE